MGQQQGRELPFDVGEQFTCLAGKTIWSVHRGRRKVDGEPVTVFVFDLTGKSEEEIKLARSAHLRLKTLRHPNILRYIDGVELPSSIYAVTEEATPLEESLRSPEGRTEFALSWGLHQTLKAISFLNNDCSLIHRCVCLSSIFVDGSGEWKLGGVEFMVPFGDLTVALAPKPLSSLQVYDPPEVAKPASAKKIEKWSVDVWGLGCLLWEVFNGPLTQAASLKNPSKLPKSLVPHFVEMVGVGPVTRPNPSDLLAALREHGQFLSNRLVSMALRVEELQIMETSQRTEFFNELNSSLSSFSDNFLRRKILPQLINAFEFGNAGTAVLGPLFKLGQLLDSVEYQKRIVPCVVKLFSSPDRSTRLNLLQQLDQFIHHLQPATVNDQIFPNLVTGFTDTAPAIREQTVKSMLLVAPKLNAANLNTQLLKYFAKCQLDEQPGIRANTTICLGKIACHLDPTTQQKVLASAFLRSLKDPFPPARCAGIRAMADTHSYYLTSDVAMRLLPALCTMTVDGDKTVRDQTFKAIKLFLDKLEKLSENPEAAAQQEQIEAATTSWTGWAVSSLASKLYKPSSGAHQPSDTSSPAPPGPSKSQELVQPVAVKEASVTGGLDRAETPSSSTQAKDTPQAEGWGGDDDWESFSLPAEKGGRAAEQGEAGQPQAKESASGAEFFDAFSDPIPSREAPLTKTSKPKMADTSRQQKTPPPFVSPALFQSKTEGSHKSDDGWGNEWTEDVTPKKPSQVEVEKPGKPRTEERRYQEDGVIGLNDTSKKIIQQGVGVATKTKAGDSVQSKQRAQPPPVNASLFQSNQDKPAVEKGTKESSGLDGWGDWSSDVAMETAPQVTTRLTAATSLQPQPKGRVESVKASSSGGGGDDGDGGWGHDSGWDSFEGPSSVGGASGGSEASKQELQRRREERKQKQLQAREKRAAAGGSSLKPSGLGAVKKE
ncbi:hypothetical protein EMCRGX_G032488 [Ephydatia muelleri]